MVVVIHAGKNSAMVSRYRRDSARYSAHEYAVATTAVAWSEHEVA